MVQFHFFFPIPRNSVDPIGARAYIDRADAVSFDVFDTALLRPFASPDHVFWLLERSAFEILGPGAPTFRQLRIDGERQARILGAQEEVTLREIYEQIAKILVRPDDDLAPLMAQELALERRLCRRRESVGDLYDYATSAGKSIFFTSDTYFDQDFVRGLLQSNGFTGSHEVIISSQYRTTKHAGELFQELLNRAGVEPTRLLHIGDNFRSDCLMAWRAGIPSLHFPSPIHSFALISHNLELFGVRRLPVRIAARSRLSSVNAWLSGWIDRPDVSLMAGLCANRYFDSSKRQKLLLDRWETLGYVAFGPLLLGFSLWLVDQFRRHGIKKAFFLSRDGKIIKEAFDLVAQVKGIVTADTTYAWCSRRAVNFARITSIDHQALRLLCDSSSPTSVADHLSRIQIDPASFADRIRAAGFGGPDDLVSPANRPKLEALFKSLEPEILDLASRERRDLIDYYGRIGLINEPGVAIVDIGWWGTMYRSLAELLSEDEKESELHAFYFGTFAEANQLRLANLGHDAYFIRYGEPLDLFFGIKQCIEIVELFFSAPHGTFIKVGHEFGRIEPVLDASDCSPLRIKAITQMQDGALGFMRDALALGDQMDCLRLSPYELSQPLRSMLAAPEVEEIACFESLVHYQDVGKNAHERKIVFRPSTLELLFRPLSFARRLSLGFWRAGTIRLLPFPARLYLNVLVRARQHAARWL